MKGTITITVTDETKTVEANLTVTDDWSDETDVKQIVEHLLRHELKGGEA